MVLLCTAAWLATLAAFESVAQAFPCDNRPNINPNATINGILQAGDCRVADVYTPDDFSYVDLYRLTVNAQANVTIRMNSTALDAFVAIATSDLSQLLAWDDDGDGGTNARLQRTLTPGTYIVAANTYDDGAGNSQTGAYTLTLTCPGCADTVAGPLVASVLPASRSVQVGQTATVFATILNPGTVAGAGCRIVPRTALAAEFTYLTTDPVTNVATGAPDPLVSIPGGGGQSFMIAVTPYAPIAPVDVELWFMCNNADPAPVVNGLDTLLMVADDAPVPDVVALAATPGNTGVVHANPAGVFAVAVSNVGASGAVEVTADTGGVSLPVQIALCETDPATSVCINPLEPAPGPVITTIDAGATPTFGVFVTRTGAVPFDPARNRVVVRFGDAGGSTTRGMTSVAIDGN